MSIAFAITRKRYGFVYSDGRAMKDGNIVNDEWDKTFEFSFGRKRFLGCHTGILLIHNKRINLYINSIIQNNYNLPQEDLINIIKIEFSEILGNADNNDFGVGNSSVNLLIIMPSNDIASFNFVIDLMTKQVSVINEIFSPRKTFATAVIGEDKSRLVATVGLKSLNPNWKYNFMISKCQDILIDSIKNCGLNEKNIPFCGGKLFIKY